MKLNIFSALQKIRQKDGKYSIVFPISRSQDVYVDIDKKISLEYALDEIQQKSALDTLIALEDKVLNVSKAIRLNYHYAVNLDSDKVIRENDTSSGYTLKLADIIDTTKSRPKKVLITHLPDPNSKYELSKVFVTNNGHDALPLWEEIDEFKTKKFTALTNTNKTDDDWGIDVRLDFVESGKPSSTTNSGRVIVTFITHYSSIETII